MSSLKATLIACLALAVARCLLIAQKEIARWRARRAASRSTAAYFMRMRAGFPAKGHFRINDMQQSFIKQTQHGKNTICFSAHIESRDVPYLFLIYKSGRVRIFATIYMIYCGELALSDEFPHGLLYGYPYDARPHREHLNALFSLKQCNKPQIKNQAAPPLIMFGVIKNLGHHIWQECTGLLCADNLGLLPENGTWFSRGYDYLGIMPKFSFESDGPIASAVRTSEYVVWDGAILRLAACVIPEFERRQLLELLNVGTFVRDVTRRRNVCLQIRIGSRRWISEDSGLRFVLETLLRAYPDREIFVDGHAKAAADSDVTSTLIAREGDFFRDLTAGMESTRVHSMIGITLREKLPLYASCELVIGPIGSGNAIPGWLMKVPSIVYGPSWLYRTAMDQEEEVPQGGPFAEFIPSERIQSVNDQDYDFAAVEITNRLRLKRINRA